MVKINETTFKIGCDPEFFVKAQNKFLCAEGLVTGTKKAPQRIINGMVQVDGMALEFGIDPVNTEKGFVRRTTNVMNRVKAMLPHGYTVAPETPCVVFPKDVFDKASEECKALGCDPDYNAYTGELNPNPDANVDFRTTSGHIHIGWTNKVDPFDNDHMWTCRLLASALDYWLGVPSLCWDSTEESIKRRNLYGKAGAFRPKPYGMEYRTLSSRWLIHPDIMSFVYRQTMVAITKLFEGNEYLSQEGNFSASDIINDSRIGCARRHCDANNIDYKPAYNAYKSVEGKPSYDHLNKKAA